MSVDMTISVGKPDGDTRTPFWGKCAGCRHCWIVVYLPIVASEFSRVVKGARCPMCAKGKIIAARQDNGVLTEIGA